MISSAVKNSCNGDFADFIDLKKKRGLIDLVEFYYSR